MCAPMDCHRLVLKAHYRSTLEIRIDSFAAFVWKAKRIEHDLPVSKYTPATIRERNSVVVERL